MGLEKTPAALSNKLKLGLFLYRMGPLFDGSGSSDSERILSRRERDLLTVSQLLRLGGGMCSLVSVEFLHGRYANDKIRLLPFIFRRPSILPI